MERSSGGKPPVSLHKFTENKTKFKIQMALRLLRAKALILEILPVV